MLFLFEAELDQFMILTKNENTTDPIDMYQLDRAAWPAIDISKSGKNFVSIPTIPISRLIIFIGADSTGATGAFAPVLARVLGREYSFAPVPFGYYIYMYMRIFRRPLPMHSDFCANVSSR